MSQKDSFYRQLYQLHLKLHDIAHNVAQIERDVQSAQDEIKTDAFFHDAYIRLGQRASYTRSSPKREYSTKDKRNTMS